MKPEFNARYTTIAVYALLVVAASAVIISSVFNFHVIANAASYLLRLSTPFIIGFVVAYILNPVLNTIERRMLIPLVGKYFSPWLIRSVSLVFAFVFAFVVLGVFFRIVVPQIAISVSSLTQQIPGWVTSAQRYLNELAVTYNLEDLLNNSPEVLGQLKTALEHAITWLSSWLTNALPQVLQATVSVTTGLLNFVLGMIISVYILLSKERFFAQTKKLGYALMPADTMGIVIDITHQSHRIFSGFISGKILDSLIIGILCFIGMTVFRMPYAMLISVIVGVTNVIPYFGPFIGAIPSILILLIAAPAKAIWFALFVLLLQQLDGNIIGPKILGDSTGLSSFWVIFSITVFGSLLGFIGMFIGVPLFAVIYSLVRQFAEWRLKKKGLSSETNAYASTKHPIIGPKTK